MGNNDNIWYEASRACWSGDLSKLESLRSQKINLKNLTGPNGNSLLPDSCHRGHLNVAKFLVETAGFDVNKKVYYYGTPLHAACESGNAELVCFLLNKKANINISTDFNGTPLHGACSNKHIDIVKILINAGANLNLKDINGKTPLNCAEHKKSLPIIKLLLENGAKVYSGDLEDYPKLFAIAKLTGLLSLDSQNIQLQEIENLTKTLESLQSSELDQKELYEIVACRITSLCNIESKKYKSSDYFNNKLTQVTQNINKHLKDHKGLKIGINKLLYKVQEKSKEDISIQDLLPIIHSDENLEGTQITGEGLGNENES